MKFFKKRAFSLIELSVVITILSIVAVGILSISVGGISNNKAKTTNDRMSLIYRALGEYVLVNKRLPCPASIKEVKSSINYGVEGTAAGTCTAGTGVYSSTTATNLVYGMVPVKTLGLNNILGEDGYENKIAYIVDKSYTSTSTFSSATSGITIQKYVGGAVTTDTSSAIFAIISYGANKNSSFAATSAIQNTVATNIDEMLNDAISFNDGAKTAVFTQNLINFTERSPIFDDVIFYRTRDNFLKDVQGANLTDANITSAANSNGPIDCPISRNGVSLTTVSGGSTQVACDVGFYTGNINYTCEGGTLSNVSGSCTCPTGYNPSGCATCANNYFMVNGTCQQDCTLTTTGINSVVVRASSTNVTKNCDATNFNTSDSFTYTCIGGNISITSGACDTCSTGSFNGTACVAAFRCTGGGAISYSGGRTIHTFTSTDNLTGCSGSSSLVNFLLVGGGGGGGGGVSANGSNSPGGAGGGGGGQVLVLNNQTVSGVSSATVTVGGGGGGGSGGGGSNGSNGGAGENSSVIGGSLSITSYGGAGGGGKNNTATNSDSSYRPGGGAGAPTCGGSGCTNGTTAGNYGGGGSWSSSASGRGGGGGSSAGVGGAGGSGASGNGAAGVNSSISASTIMYGCGGGGGGTGATGGCSTAGNGAISTTSPTSGSSGGNRGGGGGGGGGAAVNGASGNSGIVIISYPTP